MERAEAHGVREGVDYVPLIQQQMEVRHLGLRRMELLTGINRTRLGRILHRDVAKRASMTLLEFQTILSALGMDPIQAIVSVELLNDLDIANDERFAKLALMLATLYRGLPHGIVEVLREMDGLDGSDIREEWGAFFQRGVIKKIGLEVGQMLLRRARLAEEDDPFAF